MHVSSGDGVNVANYCGIYAGALITGMGPQESGILTNSWVPPVNGTLPDVSPISGAGKV